MSKIERSMMEQRQTQNTTSVSPQRDEPMSNGYSSSSLRSTPSLNNGSRSSERMHRRTMSDDGVPLHTTIDGRAQMYYNYSSGPSPVIQQQQQQQPPPVVSYSERPSPPRRTSARPSHHRSRSFPNNPFPPPGAAVSAAGNPLIPIMTDSSTYNRRKRADSAGYASLPKYGSVDENAARRSSDRWSPRSEIMSLTSKFQPSSLSPRNMTSTRKVAPLSPMHTHQRTPSPHHVSFSPTAAVQMERYTATASVRGIPHWAKQDVYDNAAPESEALLGGRPVATATPRGAEPAGHGEAVFEARNRRRSSKGSRKQHMRAASAQFFMEDTRGVQQPKACRDILFLLLFLFHLVGMAFLGTTYGPDAFVFDHAHDPKVISEKVTLSYRNVIYVASLCGAFAILLSTIALILMTLMTKRLVQVALFLTIAASFAWGTIGIGLSPKNFVPITGIIALALSVGYTFVVWDRIPFAAANLHAGLCGVRTNAGTVIVAFIFQGLALGWTVYFVYVCIGVYDALLTGHLALSNGTEIFVYCMLGVSYYWVFHVLMNIVQVTVAGTFPSFWFNPRERPTLWSETVSSSFFSAMFYSSGSVCFGSLLVGPVRLLRMISAFFRPNQEESMLSCLHECVHMIQQCFSGCVDGLAAQFNSWAYTYIGLYGYGLLDAGHNATELFEKRGWTTIVKDDLVSNVLLLLSLVIGGVTGCFGFLIQEMDNLGFTSLEKPESTAFLIGLGVGWVLTCVLFAVITSSVNSVIVLFAGNPMEFDQNHSELSTVMKSAWREVWPGCMDLVDMRRSGIMGVSPQLPPNLPNAGNGFV